MFVEKSIICHRFLYGNQQMFCLLLISSDFCSLHYLPLMKQSLILFISVETCLKYEQITELTEKRTQNSSNSQFPSVTYFGIERTILVSRTYLECIYTGNLTDGRSAGFLIPFPAVVQ